MCWCFTLNSHQSENFLLILWSLYLSPIAQILLCLRGQSEGKLDWFSGLPYTQQLFLGKWVYNLKLVAAYVRLMSCIFYKSFLNKELFYPWQLLCNTAAVVTDIGLVLADRFFFLKCSDLQGCCVGRADELLPQVQVALPALTLPQQLSPAD